jgi:hypothetical protein
MEAVDSISFNINNFEIDSGGRNAVFADSNDFAVFLPEAAGGVNRPS